MVWQTGSLAPLSGQAGMRGSVRAGLSRGSLLALGHPASTGSGEAAPDLYPMEREGHLLGSAELRLVRPCLLASTGESPVYGVAVKKIQAFKTVCAAWRGGFLRASSSPFPGPLEQCPRCEPAYQPPELKGGSLLFCYLKTALVT